MARDNTLTVLLLAGAAYFAYHYFSTAAPGGSAPLQLCKFPDGSTVAMPSGNQCPYDPSHGGQSSACYSGGGTLPAGGVAC